jgi:uncharacterized protein
MNCRHCYHPPHERTGGVMPPEILERVIRKASEEYETVWFIWHGGEPLLVPLSFYKDAASLQEKYFGKDSHRVSNTIQTNGTLISKKFMNFCKEKKINVGVSFEGPCNNILREMTGLTEKNIGMMKKGGHKFSVSSAICSHDVKELMNIYDHFMGDGIALSLSHVIRSGSATEDMVPDADEYADMSIKVFDRWLHDVNAEMPLMPHMQYVMNALGEPTPADCAHSSCIFKWMSVYPNGDIYPCAKGCPSGFRLCNIADIERLSDAFMSDSMKDMLSASVERRSKCMSSCSLYKHCNGGCSIDALSEGNISENGGTSCLMFKKIFSHILATINDIIRERRDLSAYNRFVREAVIGKLVNPKIVNI